MNCSLDMLARKEKLFNLIHQHRLKSDPYLTRCTCSFVCSSAAKSTLCEREPLCHSRGGSVAPQGTVSSSCPAPPRPREAMPRRAGGAGSVLLPLLHGSGSAWRRVCMDMGLHGERVCVARGLLAWFSCGKPPLAALQDNTKQKQKLAGEQLGARAGLCPAQQLAQRHEALRFPATGGAVSCSLGDQRCGCPRAALTARGPCTGSGLWLRAASKLQGPEGSECLPPARPALKLSPSEISPPAKQNPALRLGCTQHHG